MLKDTDCLLQEIKQELWQNYLSFPCLTLKHAHTHMKRHRSPSPPPAPLFPHPPLPSRLVLTTLAVRLSHTHVISSAAAGAYGNVTGRRWTWWLLTHSSPLCCTSPWWKDWCRSNRKQVAETDAHSHMNSKIDLICRCHSSVNQYMQIPISSDRK